MEQRPQTRRRHPVVLYIFVQVSSPCVLGSSSPAMSIWLPVQRLFWYTCVIASDYRVPTPPGKSWIFFLENSRTWKVLENHFGPGKSWKLKLKVLENPAFF